MIDHHVDRPGVDVRQRTKLTGPNRPTGSISAHHTQHAPVSGSVISDQREAGKAGRPPTQHKTSRDKHQNLVHPCQRLSFATLRDGLDDLVALAGGLHPIPSRTRP